MRVNKLNDIIVLFDLYRSCVNGAALLCDLLLIQRVFFYCYRLIKHTKIIASIIPAVIVLIVQ